MRSILIPTLGAVLSFGSSGVFAGVIRDTQKVTCTDAFLGSSDLTEVTQCIQEICSSGGSAGAKRLNCGPAVLTLSSAPSDIKDCVDHFRAVIDQCTTPDGAHGGVAKAHGTQYEISVVATQAETDAVLNQRREDRVKRQTKSKGKTGSGTTSKTQPKTRPKPVADPKGAKNTPKGTPKVTPKATPVVSSKPAAGKATPSGKSAASGKPTNTRSSSAAVSESACPIPLYKPDGKPAGKMYKEEPPLNGKSTKGKTGTTTPKTSGTTPKSGKTARDVTDGSVSELERRTGSSSGSSRGGSSRGSSSPASCINVDRYYRVTELKANVATWWRFAKRTGWEDIRSRTRGGYEMIRGMPAIGGKLDVIHIKRGQLSFQGSSRGSGVQPGQYAAGRGDYLLTNGGFFVMPGMLQDERYDYASVGQTNINNKAVRVPREYQSYYRQVDGDDGSFIQSGPSLRSAVPITRPEFDYNDQTARILGSLSHASQPNERLAVARMRNGDKFVFVYTADRRRNGVNVNQLRDLIDDFLRLYVRVDIADALQVINLDGGGSIYVSWNDGREFVIAQGSSGDGTPGTAGAARTVANVMIID